MDNKNGILKRAWGALRKPSAKYSVLALLVTGFASGLVFWGGFSTAMHTTNSLEFCISCHEMRDTVYEEYKKTVHYSNRTGVRAVCSDCHTPRDWRHKMVRKLQASQEVWASFTGYIGTPEKFEAHRMEMATWEWTRLKASDSQECRDCHTFTAMSGDWQKQTAFKEHTKAQGQGQTCIDCHKGIAHKLPKEYVDPDEQ